jgi:hypothetical protein
MKTENEKLKPHTTPKPRSYRRLWISLIAVVGLSFLVLGYYGSEIYRKAPPIPRRVVTADGQVLFTAQDIKDGQNVWQSIGGQQLRSIWGTAHMWRRIGRPIGCIARLCGCSTIGLQYLAEKLTNNCQGKPRPPCANV